MFAQQTITGRRRRLAPKGSLLIIAYENIHTRPHADEPKISPQEVSEYPSGAADINKEIFSAEKKSLVLHDSRGYGVGERKNFQKLK